MESRKLLIAEGSDEFRAALAEALTGEYHVRTCGDGEEAQWLLRTFQPDMMILDLMLPQIDGLTLLQAAREEGRVPTVLAISRFVSDYVMESMPRMGIAYIMRKPCTVWAAVTRIRDMDRMHHRDSSLPELPERLAGPDPRVTVTNILLSLGFKSSHDGYMYLREGILMMYGKPDQPLTKELYPEVAELFHRGGANVERSGRTAIDYAWKRGDKQIWRMYFTPDGDGVLRRPSNGAFITRMVEALRAAERRRW